VADDKPGPKNPGPKGGIKHTPGRGHDSKSSRAKRARFQKRAAKLRKAKEDLARKLWTDWDEMPPERRRLLGPKGEPKLPRPKNED
jgi:hypothetical protein